MRIFLLLLTITSIFPSAALAQSCFGMAKDSAAYQTCMLRVENNSRQRETDEKNINDQEQKNKAADEKKYQLLIQRNNLLKEATNLCTKNPTEDCESLARKHGFVQKIQELKAEADRL